MTIKEFHDKMLAKDFEFYTDNHGVWSFNKVEDDFGWTIYLNVDPTSDEPFVVCMYANPHSPGTDAQSFDVGSSFEKVFEILDSYTYEPKPKRNVKFSVEYEMETTKEGRAMALDFASWLWRNLDLIKIEDNSQ